MNNKILTYPDPYLVTEAVNIKRIDNDTLVKINHMFKVLEEYDDALGLSSNQVGLSESIILYRENGKFKDDLKVLINAKIVSILDTNVQRSEEGCLSLPEIFIPIRRYKKIEVVGLDQLGKKVEIVADGMLSNILQHEIDHINGFLMIDRLSRLQKNLFKKKLKGLQSLKEKKHEIQR